MGGENTVKVTRKIRIYPNKTQKEFFDKCFGVTRYIYNETVEYINNKYSSKRKELNELSKNGCVFMNSDKQCSSNIDSKSKYFCKKHSKKKIDYGFKLNLPFIRNAVLTNDSDLTDDMKWLKEIPYDTRQLVIKDFIAAYKAALSNFKSNNSNAFQMGFKSKRNISQIFHINKRAITKDLNIFRRRKIGKVRTRKRMRNWINKNIEEIESDCKIIRYKPSQYYLLLTINKKIETNNAPLKSVSLDPGVRTFQTIYSPDGLTGKLGDNLKEKLKEYHKKIDLLNSLKNGSKRRTIKNINKRQNLLRTKIKNVVDDMQWKIVDFLTKNFESIILPDFKVKNMTEHNKERRLNNITVRSMLSLSHYKFKERLKYKANQRSRNLIVVDESYTSQTCGNCGNLKKDLGSSKDYSCKKCNILMDRDINGARNILLKYISSNKWDAVTASPDHDTGSLKCIKLKDFKKNVNKQKNLMYEIGT